MSIAYTVMDRERETCIATGVSYGVRQPASGRWYWREGRFCDGQMPVFTGPHEALTEMQRYFRESEIALMELVPCREHEPCSGCEAEAAALLEAGPQPLLLATKKQTNPAIDRE